MELPGGLGRRVCWSWRPTFGGSRISSFKFPCFLREGKKAVYKTDFEKGFFFFFFLIRRRRLLPPQPNVGFSSPSLFVVVFFLSLLLTHIVRFQCGGLSCSKRVGAATMRQDTSDLPHTSGGLGWAVGQGSIPPPRTFRGPARCIQHQRPAVSAM